MAYLERQQMKTFIDKLGRSARWGMWYAVLISLITTLLYIATQTNSEHLMYLSIIGSIWTAVYAGIELKLSRDY